MSSGAGVASRSARSSSASSAAAMPSKRKRASSVCNSSRIPVSLEIEEVAGHLLQDQGLQALQIKEAEAQSFLDGGKEWPRRVGALQLEQPAQRPHTAPVCTALEGSRIALKARMLPTQQLLLERGAAVGPRWRGMMTRQRGARIALANEPPMAGNLTAATIDDDLGGMLVHTY